MTKSVIYFILFLQALTITSQTSIYDFVDLGPFQVGYKDTLVYDTTYEYKAFGYTGAKPQFVQIWHPLPRKYSNVGYLTFNDLFSLPTIPNVSLPVEQLKKHYQEAVIKDCITENLVTGGVNDFGTFTYNDILNLMRGIKTRSTLHRAIKAPNRPVIVYHHGSTSFPFENYVMAEYFASRGFIFVTANFHLPYENKSYGLKPYEKIIKNEEENSLRAILKFARSLSRNPSVFFIGHSWGAQMGLRALDADTTIKGLISLETTLEFKEDYNRIKELWPEVYQKIVVERAVYHFPILFCAATGQRKPFTIFKDLDASRITFAPTEERFEHNAYTSAFYLRGFITPDVRQTDKELLLDRLRLYVKHLKLMNDFIEEIRNDALKPKMDIRFVGNE